MNKYYDNMKAYLKVIDETIEKSDIKDNWDRCFICVRTKMGRKWQC